jgi:DNA-binding beta-propeller fold protein YncE
MFFDGRKYVYLITSDFYDPNIMKKSFEESKDFGDVYIIDIGTQKIVKMIEIPRDYKDISDVCNVGNKIYIAAMKRTMAGYKYNSNKEILVFSLSSGKLINKIPISPHPLWLTYDKSVHKIYVLHRDDYEPHNKIEVIDTITDKVIGSFKVESQLMFSVVAPGKMYITQGPSFMHEDKETPPKLLVFDTKTDKIIKEIEGNYQGISVNPKY